MPYRRRAWHGYGCVHARTCIHGIRIHTYHTVAGGKFKFIMSAEPGRKTAYTRDIGWRVIWQQLGMEHEFRDIARQLQIAVSTAHCMFKKFELTGEIDPKKQPSRPATRVLDDQHELLNIGLILENPCLYLNEICFRIYETTGTRVSAATVCRILKRYGFMRKKARQVAKQRCVEFRAAYIAQVSQFDPRCFVWVDESGSDARNHVRKFGYELRGLTPHYHRFLARGKRVSAIAAISYDGCIGADLTTGSVNGDKFLEFVHGTLIPEMEPFDGSIRKSIVILDNCSVHHIAEVKQALEDAGVLVIYLPTYSPDLNPIEEILVIQSTI